MQESAVGNWLNERLPSRWALCFFMPGMARPLMRHACEPAACMQDTLLFIKCGCAVKAPALRATLERRLLGTQSAARKAPDSLVGCRCGCSLYHMHARAGCPPASQAEAQACQPSRRHAVHTQKAGQDRSAPILGTDAAAQVNPASCTGQVWQSLTCARRVKQGLLA